MSFSPHPLSAPTAVTNFEALDGVQEQARRHLLDLQARLVEPTAAQEPPRGLLRRLRTRRVMPAQPVVGLYLWGGVGRGKTYLMDWFCDALPVAQKRRVHFHHFMREVHDAMSKLPRQPDPLEVIGGRWREGVRVLCLDEFVVTDIADAMILHRLLGALLRRGMTLVITSNTHPEQLYRNGLQRQSFLPAIELLKTHTRVFELAGTLDYRLRNLSQAGVYFVGAEGVVRLAEHFEHLTGGHGAVEERFSVNGRTFPARRVGPDVAWFDFQDLCATPRCVADYIEIARLFHTVLLSGVPVFTHRQEAAARRFVHLIDEFYDRRVKLVIAAAAPIAQLYPGGFVDFPFERVRSRLVEMQSHAYLAAPGTA
ncbi:cell division protein ZapE [Candidatus Thiodictyon syntrophicum]|uniref:cell division protein ZapE n=1 Tax=Candidatus Thiodictyon syntrophicum TaxID=1166950 RepID=UPI001EEEA678|nr:cell division protein ZapE [Candidatus Thiodictyon syntrophicum]